MTDERRAAERLAFGIVSWVTAIVAIVILVPLAWKYLSPFLLALPAAAMLQRPARWLEKKLPLKPGVMRMIITLFFIVVALGLLVWFLSYGIGQVIVLANESVPLLSGWIGDTRRAISSLLASIESLQPSEVNWIQNTVNTVLEWLSSQVSTIASTVVTFLGSAAAQVPYAFLYANFLFLGIFFISKRYEEVIVHLPGGKKSLINRNSTLGRLIRSAVEGLVGFVKVQLVYGVITFVVSVIFWSIVGIPRAVLIALLSGLLEMIPLIGNGVILIPWSIVALLIGNYAHAIEAISLYLLLQLIRRMSEPKLLSHNTGISPLLTLIGMFAGLMAGGIVGLIGGPVVMSVLVSVHRGNYIKPIIEDMKALRQALRVRWQAPLPTDIPEDEITDKHDL